jgi:hypothetical protein
MRKFVLIAIAALFCSISYGQLGLGIKGAFTMSNLSPNLSDYEDAAQAGFQLGAFVRVGKKLHLQPEIYFTAKSGDLTFDQDVIDPDDPGNTIKTSVTQDVTLNTLDIPVLIGYKLMDAKKFNVRLQAGPVGSIVLNKKFDITLDGASSETPDELPDSFNDFNWGLQLGAGVDFLFLTADVRYELGLNDLNDPADDNFAKFKNNVFFISIGWKIL